MKTHKEKKIMITFNELLERAKRERIAIHTPTEKQAIALLNELDKKGYTWGGGTNLTDNTNYEYHEKFTCYNFGISNDSNEDVMYSPLAWYQGADYTIIEFSDIDFKENV